jgi:hypothetical protein
LFDEDYQIEVFMEYIIVPLSVLLGLLGFSLIAKWYVVPALDSRPRDVALLPLILLHVFRYLGAWFLISGVVSSGLPPAFAIPAAYGDLITVILALFGALALRSKWSIAGAAVWLFNVFGALDLLNALLQGLLHIQHPGQLGATFIIPIFYVPALLVSHFLIFRLLLKRSS